MSVPTDYSLPDHTVGLRGPVERPAPGTLPIRGDLAHIALADRFLAAHYVIPVVRHIGAGGVVMRRSPREDSAEVIALAAGEAVEALDYSGSWAWIACGPEGPSGYVPCSDLAAEPAAEDGA